MARKARIRSKDQTTMEFAVIGLGYFGASLARRLETMGHTVLGIDSDLTRVQAVSDDITSAVALDATNEDALQSVDIGSFATVILGITDDFEASALITAYLKGLGIGRVITLAKTSRHRNILLRIGADQVILSDEDSGVRLADMLALPDVQDLALLDAEHTLAQLRVPDGLAGQPVSSVAKCDVHLVLIQRQGQLLPCPEAAIRIEEDDMLFVVGRRECVLALAALP